MNTGKCKDCRFFNRQVLTGPQEAEVKIKGMPVGGWCFRNPPQVMLLPAPSGPIIKGQQGPQVVMQSVWPEVSEALGCGSHEAEVFEASDKH